MLLMVDNYDSFTYNVVQYLVELGADVEVVSNDEVDLTGIRRMAPQRVVISPGPCSPDEAGISVPLIREFGDRVPILGVCLGHQCIGAAFGGRIARATRVMHGKTSLVEHNCAGIFRGLPKPLRATRYHSLVVEAESLPAELEVTAWTEEPGGHLQIMGLQHRSLPIHGVQFHPESILSDCGHALLQNFLNLPEATWK